MFGFKKKTEIIIIVPAEYRKMVCASLDAINNQPENRLKNRLYLWEKLQNIFPDIDLTESKYSIEAGNPLSIKLIKSN
jgi:hypothetical protein